MRGQRRFPLGARHGAQRDVHGNGSRRDTRRDAHNHHLTHAYPVGGVVTGGGGSLAAAAQH